MLMVTAVLRYDSQKLHPKGNADLRYGRLGIGIAKPLICRGTDGERLDAHSRSFLAR